MEPTVAPSKNIQEASVPSNLTQSSSIDLIIIQLALSLEGEEEIPAKKIKEGNLYHPKDNLGFEEHVLSTLFFIHQLEIFRAFLVKLSGFVFVFSKTNSMSSSSTHSVVTSNDLELFACRLHKMDAIR